MEWIVESDIFIYDLRDRLDALSSLGYTVVNVLGPYPPSEAGMMGSHTIIANRASGWQSCLHEGSRQPDQKRPT